jgi:hypothetical protein
VHKSKSGNFLKNLNGADIGAWTKAKQNKGQGPARPWDVPRSFKHKSGECRINLMNEKEKWGSLGPGPTGHCLTQADEVHPDVDGCRWQPRRPLPGRTPKRRRRTSDGRSSEATMSVCEKHCTTGISLQVKTKTYPERKKLDTLKGKS